MAVPITALYAGLLALYAIYLSFQVGSMRGKTGISILHDGNMELAEKMRRHGNFIEYVPIALILIGIVELNGYPAWLLHGMGVTLIVARVAHATGLHHDDIRHPLRAVGGMLTALLTVVAAGIAIWIGVTALIG